MSNPLISVIIPCKNVAGYVYKAINSIINQTYKNLEIIVLDDNSSDQTFYILQKLADLDNRIKLFKSVELGLINNLNYGISISKGKYIARMDGDDISHPNRLEKQLLALKISKANICGCDFFTLNENNFVTEKFITPSNHHECLNRFVKGVPYCHGSLLFDKNIKKMIRYDDSQYTSIEDYYLQLELIKEGAIYTKANDFLYYLRLHNKSFSNSKQDLMNKDSLDLSNKYFKDNISFFNSKKQKSIRGLLFSNFYEIKEKFLIIKKLKQSKKINNFNLICLSFIYYFKFSIYLALRIKNKSIYFLLRKNI